MLKRAEDAQLRGLVDVLRVVPIFQHFSKSVLTQMAEVMHVRQYKREEFLYYENDPGLGLYIVRSGRVRLLTEDAQGDVHELRQVGEYELLGEVAVLGDFRRMESAQALVDTEVLGFFSPDMKVMANRTPKVHAAMTTALAQHLATQQVWLMQLLTQQMGKVDALRLRDEAHALQQTEAPVGRLTN